jgi:hypothetical protein
MTGPAALLVDAHLFVALGTAAEFGLPRFLFPGPKSHD